MPTAAALLAAAVLVGEASTAVADLRIFACEPEWAALSREIGGDHVTVDSAVTGLQDVHYIEARPSLIAKTRRADLIVCTGAGLEVGWLPLLLRQSANPKVQPGRKGLFEASSVVDMLEVPVAVDRAEGDLHPFGNPHIQLDPRNIALVAGALARRMAELDAANAELYSARHWDFSRRWQAAIKRWEDLTRALKGMAIIVHHRSWVYLVHWLGLKETAVLEPIPGVPPSAGHLSRLLGEIHDREAKLIIRASYQSSRASEWLSRRSNIPAMVLPHTVGSTDRAKDLFAVFDEISALLVQAAAR